MLSDYINKEAVSKMSYKDFKEILGGNIAISRHKMTMKQAFKELGGKLNKSKQKSGGE